MDKKQNQEVAAFRFSVISDLIACVPSDDQPLNKLIKDKAARHWNIPYSDRFTLSESTIKRWLNTYLAANRNIKSLYPQKRTDNGATRVIDDETAAILIQVRKEYHDIPITELIEIMRQKGLLPLKNIPSLSTIYRFFKQHTDIITKKPKADRRRFEAEFPNDIWQSDIMHGPRLKLDKKMRKICLIAFIDDHSRLITNAVFDLQENLKCYLKALKIALLTRGVPKKLYVDNGSAFKSHHLSYITAALQINLIHARPYSPQGKGKIERFFRTVRSSFLSEHLIEEIQNTNYPLMELNERLLVWLMERYHPKKHSATAQTPFNRYKNGIEMVRDVPDNLDDYFRLTVMRTVTKDRVVHLNGKIYETPVDLIGERIELLYHDDDPPEIEARFGGKSYGLLKPVDLGVNVRVKRAKYNAEIILENSSKNTVPKSGKLFNKRGR